MQPTLANILGRKLLVSGSAHIWDLLTFLTKKFPRMHREIVLLGGLMKDQLETVQISCNICVSIKHTCIIQNSYFLIYVFVLCL